MHLVGGLFCSFRVTTYNMLKVMRFPRYCKCVELSNVAKLPTFSVANVAGPSAYKGCRVFSVAELCGGLRNEGTCY